MTADKISPKKLDLVRSPGGAEELEPETEAELVEAGERKILEDRTDEAETETEYEIIAGGERTTAKGVRSAAVAALTALDSGDVHALNELSEAARAVSGVERIKIPPHALDAPKLAAKHWAILHRQRLGKGGTRPRHRPVLESGRMVYNAVDKTLTIAVAEVGPLLEGNLELLARKAACPGCFLAFIVAGGLEALQLSEEVPSKLYDVLEGKVRELHAAAGDILPAAGPPGGRMVTEPEVEVEADDEEGPVS